jgi:hypothetical protein
MWRVTRSAWLITGSSLGEALCVWLLVGVILLLAARSMPGAISHAAQTEALVLATAHKLHWIEQWANDGPRDPSATKRLEAAIEGKFSTWIPDDAGDGSLSLEFNGALRALEGEVISLRPAFPADDIPRVVVWVCGDAPTPRGFAARGANHTTLHGARIMSPCRRRAP